MWTFIGDNLALILGFAASALTGLFAYWQSTRSDTKAKDEFLFGSINHVVELIKEDNAALRAEITQLKARIEQLETRILALVAAAEKKGT